MVQHDFTGRELPYIKGQRGNLPSVITQATNRQWGSLVFPSGLRQALIHAKGRIQQPQGCSHMHMSGTGKGSKKTDVIGTAVYENAGVNS